MKHLDRSVRLELQTCLLFLMLAIAKPSFQFKLSYPLPDFLGVQRISL